VRRSYAIIFFIFLLPFLLFLSSCFPSGVDTGSTDLGQADNNTPSFLNQTVSENLYINSEVSFDPDLQWKTFEVNYEVFDQDKCREIFAAGKVVTESYNFPSSFVETEQALVLIFSDGSFISIDQGFILYQTPTYARLTYSDVIFGAGYSVRDDLGVAYNQNELETLDKENAVGLVSAAITSLGIPVYLEPNVYALDYDSLMSEWEDFTLKDGTPAPSWTKEDEAYVVEFFESIDTLPITNAGYIDEERGRAISGGRVYGVVSKEGLIALFCSGIFEVTSSQATDIVSLDAAIETVDKKYQNIIISNPVAITHISAVLIPCYKSVDPLRVTLMPGWVFSASQTITTQKPGVDETGQTSHFNIFINGTTGAEIRIGGPA
jgi:hypothetical protein